MSLKAKLSPTKYINFWNYIVIENVERKKIRKSLTFHNRTVFPVSRLDFRQYFLHRNPCHVHVTLHPRA